MLIKEEYLQIERSNNGDLDDCEASDFMDKRYLIGDSGVYEPFTDNIGRLFRDLQQEHGRCVSKVYVDLKDGTTQAIGWVFLKRRKYQDCQDTYLAETWVTLYERYEKHTVIDCEYVSLGVL